MFKQGGTVTAGNSSQRSDGAAAVVVMERSRAEALGLRPLGRFVGYAVGGVAPEVMGIGPTVAIPKVLELTGLRLDDIDLIELNEAFASQTLAVIRELDLDLDKLNVNGGAIALGHPMGATGTKLTVQLLAELARRKARYGMVTMCVGGGQGAAGIFENLQNQAPRARGPPAGRVARAPEAGAGQASAVGTGRAPASWRAWATRRPAESHTSASSSNQPPCHSWPLATQPSQPGAGRSRR